MTFQQIRLFFLFSILFFTCQTQAQTLVWSKKAEDALEESKRLIVMLVNPGDVPKDDKTQKRKFMLRAYEKYVASFNEMIQEPIPSHWTLTKKIEFMTVGEVLALRKKADSKQKDQILIMWFPGMSDRFFDVTASMTSDDVIDFSPEKVKPPTDRTQNIFVYRLSAIFVDPTDENSLGAGENFALASYKCNRWWVSKSDLIFCMENAQELLRSKAKGESRSRDFISFDEANKGKLAGKTLLIPTEYTVDKKGKKTITEAELKKAYPWPWRFATPAEINEALDKKDATLAVLVGTEFSYDTNNMGTYFWAVDASDARTILGYSTPGNKNIGIATVAKEHDVYDLNVRRVGELVKNASVEKAKK